MGVGGQHHALAALPPGKTRYPLYRRLGGLQGPSASCMHQSNILTLSTPSWNRTILYNFYLHNNHQFFDKESQYQSTASDQQRHASWGPLDTVNHPFHTCQLSSQRLHGWKVRLFKDKQHSFNYNTVCYPRTKPYHGIKIFPIYLQNHY